MSNKNLINNVSILKQKNYHIVLFSFSAEINNIEDITENIVKCNTFLYKK